VSVYLPQTYIDGRGNTYTRPILRVALSTPTPGDIGQMAIAASRAGSGPSPAGKVLKMGADEYLDGQVAAYARRMNGSGRT
jgi:hypothetical protein